MTPLITISKQVKLNMMTKVRTVVSWRPGTGAGQQEGALKRGSMEVSRMLDLHYNFIGCRLRLSKRINPQQVRSGHLLFYLNLKKKKNQIIWTAC